MAHASTASSSAHLAHALDFLAHFHGPDPSPPPPAALLDAYFHTTTPPTIHEHGPAFAHESGVLPFLGRPFHGRDACLEYFSLMSGVLALEILEIVGHVVGDDDARVVVTGECRCTSRATGREWRELCVWTFEGWEEVQGVGVRFGRWDIWADAASAWVAVGGGGADSVGWKKGEAAP